MRGAREIDKEREKEKERRKRKKQNKRKVETTRATVSVVQELRYLLQAPGDRLAGKAPHGISA